jgi:hypothetical protein
VPPGRASLDTARTGPGVEPGIEEPPMPSTVIRSIDYRPETRELDVLFTTGRRYLFHDVPPEATEAFRQARIKGRHFNGRIRGRYSFSEALPD